MPTKRTTISHAARVDLHATVRIGGYTIPLIGIDRFATQGHCDGCKDGPIHIQELEWNLAGNQLLCWKCRGGK